MSLSKKTKKWLSENASGSIKGKTVLVTGANSGVGFKTAETALYLGAKVILACRSAEKAAKARTELLRDYPDASVGVMLLDLASFASIDAFADELRNSAADIDAFINNAGVFHRPGETTADGFELVIGTNYIGTYYLTERVLPYLASLPHEVIYINTISMIHKIAKVDYKDFYCAKRYRNFPVYARSKLCLAKYTYELAQRCKDSNLRIYMNHPGMAITPMGLNAFSCDLSRWAKIFAPLFNTAEKSSLSAVYIMSHRLPAGSIAGPSKGFGGWGYPKNNHIYRKVKTGAEELTRFTNREIYKKIEHPEN